MSDTLLCEHYECRCARASELALIADRTRRAVYLAEALAVHDQQVTCRRPNPLPEEQRRSEPIT